MRSTVSTETLDNVAQARDQRHGRPDLPIWTTGTGFLASALGLAASGASLDLTVLVIAGASAGSIVLAKARTANDLPASILVDRAVQGILAGALLWLAQLLVAQTPFGILDASVAAPFVFLVFAGLMLAEIAAASSLCALSGRWRSGAVSVALLIDNRAFGTLGTLKR